MSTITGLHHVSVISGSAQETVDFYVGVLGMRLVKRTVNQDAPTTYHLFFADGAGTPGTELTFFPLPRMARTRAGTGMTSEVALAVPPASLDYWAVRLAEHGVGGVARHVRFGEPVLAFEDPHGLALSLVETADPREFVPWAESPVPASHQIRGLHAARLTEQELGPTAQFLSSGLGFELLAEEDAWRRYAVAGGGSGRLVDVRERPDAPRAFVGTGGVHHVAFRVADDAAELAARSQVEAAGARPTEVIDRFWFKSIYLREPGGALFEIATDGPGLVVDEELATLGERLILPPFLEPKREQIERALPPLAAPLHLGR